jgi:hypothetical protein
VDQLGGQFHSCSGCWYALQKWQIVHCLEGLGQDEMAARNVLDIVICNNMLNNFFNYSICSVSKTNVLVSVIEKFQPAFSIEKGQKN